MDFAMPSRSITLVVALWFLSLTILPNENSSTLASANQISIIDQRMQLFKQSAKSIKEIKLHIKAGEIELATNKTEFHITLGN